MNQIHVVKLLCVCGGEGCLNSSTLCMCFLENVNSLGLLVVGNKMWLYMRLYITFVKWRRPKTTQL